MTPPLCLRCDTPVKRAKGSWKSDRGDRVVGGVRWCWFCSRVCNGRNKDRLSPDIRLRIGRANHEAAERRTLTRIVEICKGQMDARGMVPVKAIVKSWIIESRQAYGRGFSVGWLKGKRERQKAEAA